MVPENIAGQAAALDAQQAEAQKARHPVKSGSCPEGLAPDGPLSRHRMARFCRAAIAGWKTIKQSTDRTDTMNTT